MEEKFWEEFVAEAAQHGVDKRTINRLFREAEITRKGVVISISKRVKEDFEVKPVDRDQKSIVTLSGLTIDYITGIEPLGKYEWEELEKIQQNTNGESEENRQ